MPNLASFIAVDVGNSGVKLGVFRASGEDGLATPSETFHYAAGGDPALELVTFCERLGDAGVCWRIASVYAAASERLIEWIRQARPGDVITEITRADVPIDVAVAAPDRVGIDRLLAAAAANVLREPARPAVVADLGSAITVDLVSEAGVFLGGAILPGAAMSTRALHEATDRLPPVAMELYHDPPPPLGDSTEAAIRSGVYWGAIGAIRELAGRLSANRPSLFVSGGFGEVVAELLSPDAVYVPHLVLSGIALTAGGISS